MKVDPGNGVNFLILRTFHVLIVVFLLGACARRQPVPETVRPVKVTTAAGAAVMGQTSLPIGGSDTNCVLAGHRGWNGAAYFLYINQLEPGDTVTVTNLWETLNYQVKETRIIDPNDVEAILIQPGHELLTLLTCHPPASGGKQRYLVFCERTYL